MNQSNGGAAGVWFGADPGGIDSFGVALIDIDGSIDRGVVTCADEAIAWLSENLRSRPLRGTGIDAPLWWSSARSSDRLADQRIRKHYGISGGTVQAGNSLSGAALIQGALTVSLLRRQLPDLPVTEAHPKALLRGPFSRGIPTDLPEEFGPVRDRMIEHERDAVISAFAAREGFEGRWKIDLTDVRRDSEQDPKSYWLGPICYFWPESI